MAENENKSTMGWDSGISAKAGEYQVPPIGEYKFYVANFERSFSKAGNPMAVLTLSLNVNGQAYERRDYLVLSENMEWKLAQFFECLGLKKKGEALTRMPWDQIIGKEGICKLIHEDYNGQTQARIGAYIAPTGQAAEAKTAPAEEMPFEI